MFWLPWVSLVPVLSEVFGCRALVFLIRSRPGGDLEKCYQGGDGAWRLRAR